MIPEAVFHELSAKTHKKVAVFQPKPPENENARNSTQKSDNRIQLPVLTGSYRFRGELNISGRRIPAREYCFHTISEILRNRPFPCRIVRPGTSSLYCDGCDPVMRNCVAKWLLRVTATQSLKKW